MPFNRYLPRVQYADPVSVPGHVALDSAPITDLLVDYCDDDSGASAVRFRSDNYLILHQKDIENRLGVEGLRRFFASLSSSPASDYQKALDKLSDRDLFSLCRSRHIQAPSEIKALETQIIKDVEDLALRRDRYVARLAEERAAAAAGPVEPPTSE